MAMDWNLLLSARRHAGQDVDEGGAARPFYDRNYDRILFSASFRRLANKTQVHPLYQNDNLHHRLIHSVEVASVAHTLGFEVGLALAAQGEITQDQIARMAGITRAAALAHDIGNPPFGHAGEAAIGEWFSARFAEGAGLFGALTLAQQAEFCAFEGNAHGFRILTRNEIYHPELYPEGEGMGLAGSVLGAFTKYPCRADTSRQANTAQDPKGVYCGLKKYGIFDSAWPYFTQIAKAIGLIRVDDANGTYYRRHPLVFLVEAADDICYNIMDLEDAHTAGDLPFARVRSLLERVAGPQDTRALDGHHGRLIAALRGRAISHAVKACVDAFVTHRAQIMDGTFSHDLLSVSIHSSAFADIRKVSRSEVFTSARKTELEIYGRNLLHDILGQLAPCFEALSMAQYDVDALEYKKPYAAKVLHMANVDLLGVRDAYSALQAMTDFVSGMTDRYAVNFVKVTKGGL